MGYPLRGVVKEVEKAFGSSIHTYIRAMRIAESFEDRDTSTEEERLEILRYWAKFQAIERNSVKDKVNHAWHSSKKVWRVRRNHDIWTAR